MTSIAPFMWIAFAAFLIAVPGGVMLFSTPDDVSSWRPRRLHLVRRFIGLLLILIALLAALLAFSMYRYLQLFNDRPVALVELRQEAPQRFRASLVMASSEREFEPRVRQYVLTGDAWQVDARVLRWRLPAALAGVPSLYRLERISGRYDDIEQERTGERSVYSLDDWNMPDLFTLKREFPRWLPFVDAQYGSATYMPMFDGARYLVLFNDRGGLLARPADADTAERLERSQPGGVF